MTEATFILASQSPRRADLLSRLGYVFRIQPADIDETRHAGEPAAEFVQRLAREKAQAVSGHGLPVLGADTIVVLGEQVLGKPADRDDALRMLLALSGKSHEVMTAVAICDGQRTQVGLSVTEVQFAELSQAQAEAYWASGESAGKAGAYAIQGLAEVFVEALRGSFSGVVGLPLALTARLLQLYSIQPPALSTVHE